MELSARTRLDIVHFAMRDFDVCGYSRSTLESVSARAGIPLQVMTRYFPSMDLLLDAVLEVSFSFVEIARHHVECTSSVDSNAKGRELAFSQIDIG